MPQGLSARVFWLIAGIILLAEMLAVMPGLARERDRWLWDRVMLAHLAAMSISQGAAPASPALRDDLLRLSDTVAISLSGGNTKILLLPDRTKLRFGADIHLDKESLVTGMWRADLDLLSLAPPYARIFVTYPPPEMQIVIVVLRSDLTRDLRHYVARAAARAVVLAAVTGGLVFAALNPLLVRPMRIITASIAGFRRNPSHARVGGLQWLSTRGDDEIARAARELVAMEDELRAALWRNARLAALGTAVAKISHDLRNILGSAMLTAERFQSHGDPLVQAAAKTLITGVERAGELVSRTVKFAQEGPPALTRSPVALHGLVNEAAEMLQNAGTKMAAAANVAAGANGATDTNVAVDASVAIDNLVPPGLVLSLDRNQIYRVLVNLLGNAMEAGATRISLTLETIDGLDALVITDNGPGLPRKVVANLFRPFTSAGRHGGTGLGLAIARDLIRAHGGELALRTTGPQGTSFTLTLPEELFTDLQDAPSGGDNAVRS